MNREDLTQLNNSVYELYRPPGRVEVEYVLFHGLCFSEYRNAYKTTWEVEEGSNCSLPDMIVKEFPRARVLAVSYDSCAKVSDQVGRMTFSNLGYLLVQDIIILAKVGQRGCPVVLVGYCIGGLIIKQLCIESETQFYHAEDGAAKRRLDKFLTNVRVIEFIDTPHAGSRLGKYLRLKKNCDGPLLQYLEESSPLLGRLNSDFDSLASEREWKRFCWRHSWQTPRWDSVNLVPSFEVVSEASARRGKDEDFLTIDAAHTGRALRTQSHWIYMEKPRKLVADIISETKITRLTPSVYEFYRPDGEDYEVELVFFHGLCLSEYSDAYKTTWEIEGGKGYWIRDFLPDKFTRARVLAVSYDSRAKVPVSNSDPEIMSFRHLGEKLVNSVVHAAKVGQRGCPVVLVGYCLGGLLIKQVCKEAEKQVNQEAEGQLHQVLNVRGRSLNQFLTNVSGIVYLDTPHRGSNLATYLSQIEYNGPMLEYLKESSAPLEELNREFDSLVEGRGWEQRFVWYSEKTLVWESAVLPEIQVVQEESARGGQGRLLSINAQHTGKALSNQCDQVLTFLTDFIVDILSKNDMVDKRGEVRCCPVGNEIRLNDSLYRIYEPAKDNIKMELMFFPRRQLDKDEDEDEHAYKKTWMSEDGEFWLREWLPKAFPEARILSVSYDKLCPSKDLKIVAETLIKDFTRSDFRNGQSWRPVFLVGHSSGGLVIKELCNQAAGICARGEDKAESCDDFLKNIRGIAYYGSPYLGSMLVKLETSRSAGNIFDDNDDFERELVRRNTQYKHLLSNLDWKELVLVETRPAEKSLRKDKSAGVQRSSYFVSPAAYLTICRPKSRKWNRSDYHADDFYASMGIRSNSFFSLPADHFSICRPKSRESNSFQYLVHFISTTMNEAQYVNMNVRRWKRRGIAIIIRMEKGWSGSEADRVRMEEMTEFLSFETFVLTDLKAGDIRKTIKQILLEDLNGEDECVLCFVSAHGCVRHGVQLLFDDENRPFELFSNILEPINDHRPLAGKPKVFAVDSCRRRALQRNVTTGLQQERNDLHSIGDCLLIYSTELDGLAHRFGKVSVFQSELTFQMKMLYETMDVEEILKYVQEKVAARAASHKVVQWPVIHSTLKRRLSWRSR